MGAMRVLLDRSAFHGERFDVLQACRLREAVARGKVVVYLTPVLLNETLTAYGSKRESAWQEHLTFALDIASGIFLDRAELFREELVMGRGPFARHLMPHRPSRRYGSLPRMVQVLREVARTGELAAEWVSSKQDRDESFEKSQNQKQLSKSIREEIKQKFGASPTANDLKQYPFTQMQRTERERTGRHLMSVVDKRRAHILAEQWARTPHRFPYYSAFVDGFLYNGYYAALEHYKRIDRNAQADYEQLAYLTWADVMVSNDLSFMRHAFDAIWQTGGKRFETAESFADIIRRIL